jgi:hypothetical protein
LKKRISKDWHASFPEMAMVKPLFFKKRVGCLSVSLFLDVRRGSERYNPEYGVHNLARESPGISVMLGHRLRTTRNTPDSVTVRWHDKNYREFVPRMHAQAYLPLEGPISLQNVIKAYRDYVNSYVRPHLDCLEDPAMICAWAGEEALAKACLSWAVETFKTWPQEEQDRVGGIDAWHAKMEEIIADPEKLRQITREQVDRHKLTKIPYQDFSDASYKEL